MTVDREKRFEVKSNYVQFDVIDGTSKLSFKTPLRKRLRISFEGKSND